MTVHILTINDKNGWFIEDALSKLEVYESREKGLEVFHKFTRKILTDDHLLNADKVNFNVYLTKDKFMVCDGDDPDSEPYCKVTLKEYHVQ